MRAAELPTSHGCLLIVLRHEPGRQGPRRATAMLGFEMLATMLPSIVDQMLTTQPTQHWLRVALK